MADVPRPADRTRALLLTGFAVSAIVLAVRAAPSFWSVVDDAYISARYAAQLAAGHGLVYNPGQAIEGYTNLAWVLMTAAAIAGGVDLHVFLPGLGLACALVAQGFAILLARRLGATHPIAATLPALLLAIDPNWAVASTNGIESSQFVAIVLAAAWATFAAAGGWRWPAGLLVGAAALVRPEGLAVGLGLAACDLWLRRDRLGRPDTWAIAFGVVTVAVALFAWRWSTYGAWVPNTLAAKSFRDPGAAVLRNVWFYGNLGPYWLGPAAGFVAALPGARHHPERIVTLLLAAGLFAVPMRVEEWMPGARLLLPVTALGFVLLGACAGVVPAAWRRLAGVAVGVYGAILLVGPLPDFVRHYDSIHTAQPRNPAERAAAFVGAHLPPGAWLATRDAGVLAFWVGAHVKVAELHPRALTQPHPDGRDADIRGYTPKNPDLVVLTVQREHTRDVRYPQDRAIFRDLTEPYRYLGRVEQHFHRYYDFYVRADLDVPELPAGLVVNRLGAKPPVSRDD